MGTSYKLKGRRGVIMTTRNFLREAGTASYYYIVEDFWEYFTISEHGECVELDYEMAKNLIEPLQAFIKECEDGKEAKDKLREEELSYQLSF